MICKIRPMINECTQKERETLIFAAKEVQKYLSAIAEGDFTVIPSRKCDPEEKNALYLGVNLAELPAVEDAEKDDAIAISVKGTAGVIAGSNARAVLIAAYRYLKELGFVFLRPGVRGEYFPKTLETKEISVREVPSYRHRVVCIEGCVSQKSLTETIDWLPKAGMNGYMVQFVVPRPFFERWYGGLQSLVERPERFSETLSEEDMLAMLALAEEEITKRGLMYHGVGHGWTNRAFGMDVDGWGSVEEEPEEQYREILALYQGERKLLGKRPTWTSLCFSNPRARERMIEKITEYCKAHPNLDYIQVWLSDNQNNNCECEECRKLRVSDWYIRMLNELDERMTREGVTTKVATIIYVDLFWPPVQEKKLKNKDRFLLGYAPIFRTYSEAFDVEKRGEMTPYVLNELKFPEDVPENQAYIQEWQKLYDGDSFMFEYHFMWDHYVDFAQYNHAKIVQKDIRWMKEMGINGWVNCKVQTTYFPSALSTTMMTETLWNREIDFDEVADMVLSVEFGEKFRGVKEFLAALSEHGCAKAFRGEEEFSRPENVANLRKALDILAEFAGTIEGQKANPDRQIAEAWERLEFFAQIYEKILRLALQVGVMGELGDTEEVKRFILSGEERYKEELDALYFALTFHNRLVGAMKKSKEKFIGNA